MNHLQPADLARSKSFVPPAFTTPHLTLDKRRVAVLPLQNLSPDPNDEYFADGMTDELISAISNVSGLSVISRTSVMQYKRPSKKLAAIGEDLGAGTILEGSIRKAGNKVRVAVQLIEVKEDKHLWAQNYDRELQDVFAVQSDIAERVARALEVKVLGEERHRLDARASKNTEAIALYMKGRASLNEDNENSVRTAIEYFGRAVQQDTNFALAYVGLADSYYWLGASDLGFPAMSYMNHAEGLAKAKESLDKAMAINLELGEAHATLGLWLRNELRWKEAEVEFTKALELSPSYADAHGRYAGLLVSVGKLDEALHEARRAEELDPAQAGTSLRVGTVLHYQREYDQAIEKYNQVLRLQPNYAIALLWMAAAYASKGLRDEALGAALKWKEAVGEDFSNSLGINTGVLAWFYLIAGRRDEAEAMFKQANETDPKLSERSPTLFAYWHAWSGDIDLAFKFLDKAFEIREAELWDIKVDPFWDPIRSDPRYMVLLQKLHLS